MIVGVPKEIKKDEYRIAMLPVGVHEMKKAGHDVLIQKGAGLGSGLTDFQYAAEGAEMTETAQEIFERADMILKVKEPQPVEWAMIREDQILFTYFHFAASRELTDAMMKSAIIASSQPPPSAKPLTAAIQGLRTAFTMPLVHFAKKSSRYCRPVDTGCR